MVWDGTQVTQACMANTLLTEFSSWDVYILKNKSGVWLHKHENILNTSNTKMVKMIEKFFKFLMILCV